MGYEPVHADQPKSDLMRSTKDEASDRDEFAFDQEDLFVRYAPWGDERTDEDCWAVVGLVFEYEVSWIQGRDDIPTAVDHRHYRLRSYHTFDDILVSERELKRGDWIHVDELDAEQLSKEERELLARPGTDQPETEDDP